MGRRKASLRSGGSDSTSSALIDPNRNEADDVSSSGGSGGSSGDNYAAGMASKGTTIPSF